MLEIGTSGLMSGEGKRGVAAWPKLPRLSSTLPPRLGNDPFTADVAVMGLPAPVIPEGQSLQSSLPGLLRPSSLQTSSRLFHGWPPMSSDLIRGSKGGHDREAYFTFSILRSARPNRKIMRPENSFWMALAVETALGTMGTASWPPKSSRP